MKSISIPKLTPDDDLNRITERPDGFYWQEKMSDQTYGPFPTLLEALQDIHNRVDTDFEVGESLEEAEDELGISDWVDPDTGEPAEDSQTRLNDK